MTGVGEGNPERGFSHLGLCPSCDREIPSGNLLIQYESSEGWPKMFAECPQCQEVVSPV